MLDADDPQFWEDWLSERDRATWEAGVDAAFRGAIMRQNADDVKRANPYRGDAQC